MLGTGDEWAVFAHHSVQSLTRVNRQNVLLFLDLVLRGAGFADIISDEDLAPDYVRGKPSTWHLPFEWLESEMQGHPLELRLMRWSERAHGEHRRRTTHTRIRRTDGRVRSGDAAFRRLGPTKEEDGIDA